MSLPSYPEYKDSGVPWIGSIPSNWQLAPLLGVARERYESNEGMKDENLLSLSYGRIVQKDMASNDGLLPASFETYQIARPGDVVFRLTDLQNDKRSLRTAAVSEVGIITSAYIVVEPQTIDSGYFAHLLRSYDLSKVFYSMGGGLRQSMKYDDVKRLPVLLPSKAEQATIAAFLDRETVKIDALIAEQEKLLARIAEKRKATISRAVTRGLDPNAAMKDSGIPWLGEVPAHWELSRVKTLSQFMTSGPRGWSERITEEGSLFIQSGDMNDAMQVEFDSAKRVAVFGDAEAERTRLADGDVLICITGGKTGNVAVCQRVPEPAYVNQHVCLIRPTSRVLPLFLGLVLKSELGARQLDLFQYGLKQGLSLENVGEVVIGLPPNKEQVEIIERAISDTLVFDRLIVATNHAIALLRERRGALITAAVTGQIDVRGGATC